MAEKMTLDQAMYAVADKCANDETAWAAWLQVHAHLAQPAQQNCFCDRMYPDSDPGASCGDCPTRDYKAIQPAQAVDVAALITDVCDTEPADPDKPDTVCIDVHLLTEIVERHTRAIGNAQADD